MGELVGRHARARTATTADAGGTKPATRKVALRPRPGARPELAKGGEDEVLYQASGDLGRMRSLTMRFWISLVPSKIVVNRASRQCRSTWRSVV